MSLKGKKVVMVGGSSGMGLATAQALAQVGAKVMIVSRSKDALANAAAQVGPLAETFVGDIGSELDMQALFSQVGAFDHLITTAASLSYAPIQTFDTADAMKVFASKILGPFFAVKHGSPQMSKNGSITFFSGVSAWKPMEGGSMVAAVNGALEALARTLAVELAPIRVNCVSPGIIDTPSWEDMPKKEREAFFKMMSASLPVRRIGRPEDLVEAVLFLLSNGFTTGNVLHVDGGNQLV